LQSQLNVRYAIAIVVNSVAVADLPIVNEIIIIVINDAFDVKTISRAR
jgi:hypothetical protein